MRPAGPGWANWRQRSGVSASPDSLPVAFLAWTLGCAAVYGAMFATGNFLYGRVASALVCLAIFIMAGSWLAVLLRRMLAAED